MYTRTTAHINILLYYTLYMRYMRSGMLAGGLPLGTAQSITAGMLLGLM
jgi:hypothetical protein